MVRLGLIIFLSLRGLKEASYGLDDDAQVGAQRPVLQVSDVHVKPFEHFLHGVSISVVDGSLGSESGFHLVDEQIVMGVLHDLVYVVFSLGARSYQRHVADEHIPKLGEFVKMMVAEKSLKRCGLYAVTLCDELRPLVLNHRAQSSEFVNCEGLTLMSYPFL